MDIRQTPEYATYLKLLGWETTKLPPAERSPSEVPSGLVVSEQGPEPAEGVEPVEGRRRIKIKNGESRLTRQIFIRKFPLIGSIIKVQRTLPPIPFLDIEKIAKKIRAFQITIDPGFDPEVLTEKGNEKYIKSYQKFRYSVPQIPFIPTRTLVLDINKNEENILESFSKNKRRDVRAALRGNLIIKEESDKEYIDLKKKLLLKKFILPFITTSEIQPLYRAFSPEKIKILIAYHQNIPVAGTIILLQSPKAYYWLATATKEGKKLLAPTLLVWQAIKIAKQKGCNQFDLEGVYDDRFPKTKNRLGFSKFKEGFGGKEIIYPPTLIKTKIFFCL